MLQVKFFTQWLGGLVSAAEAVGCPSWLGWFMSEALAELGADNDF